MASRQTAAVIGCPSCGGENPRGFRFCGYCGTPLAAERPVPRHDERKLVAVLFCDLVGFTRSSEHLDPEEVRARLDAYQGRVHERIAAYGGTVEKFVGDAVMAVFGAPDAHEDDAERAVLAGLAVLETVGRLGQDFPDWRPQVRVGVHAGETVVTVGARPEAGESFVAGDVVNTAARLEQSAAPDTLVVSDAVRAAVGPVVEVAALEPVPLRGKSESLARWQVLRRRARVSTPVDPATSPLVGRAREVTELTAVFDDVVRSGRPGMVTLLGEPGLGKSRLVAELFAHVDRTPQPVVWRRGRCLGYGSGVTFHALTEIVKAELGVLDTDDAATIERRLGEALPDDETGTWVALRLRSLLGLRAPAAERPELYSAWSRFLAGLTARGPAVVVVEDLHWADDALLDFVEHAARQPWSVPLLVVVTARPELLSRRPGWPPAGLTIALEPLDMTASAALLDSLVGPGALAEPARRQLLERCQGVPLFIREFARRGPDATSTEVPVTLQQLLASRLDALPPRGKRLLQAAAVVGRTFWSGAVAELLHEPVVDVDAVLDDLVRRELVLPVPDGSRDDQAEYAFQHALLRDVAYGQIRRRDRARWHLDVVRWSEGDGAVRLDEVAEVLVHHGVSAFELASETGDATVAEQAAVITARYAAMAGRRATSLDTRRAEELLVLAERFTPVDDPARARVLQDLALTQYHANELADAEATLLGTIDLLEAAAQAPGGDPELLALALVQLGQVRYHRGDPVSSVELDERAARLLAERPTSPALALVLSDLATAYAIVGDETALDVAERAVELTVDLGGLPAGRAHQARGLQRLMRGDQRAISDLERAVDLVRASGETGPLVSVMLSLGYGLWQVQGPVAALGAYADAIEVAHPRGLANLVEWTQANRLQPLVETGAYDEAARLGALHWPRLRDIGSLAESEALGGLVRARLLLGDLAGVVRLQEPLAVMVEEALARGKGDREGLAIAVLPRIEERLAVGDRSEARRLAEELAAMGGPARTTDLSTRLPALTRGALEAGAVAAAEALASWPVNGLPLGRLVGRTTTALVHGADRGEWRRLRQDWRAFGNRLESAAAEQRAADD